MSGFTNLAITLTVYTMNISVIIGNGGLQDLFDTMQNALMMVAARHV